MPLHDWTRVAPGPYHHFHQDWSVELARELNRGILPDGLAALVEQRSMPWEPDVLTLQSDEDEDDEPPEVVNGSTATLAPPRATIVQRSDGEHYAERANRIVVRHDLGRVVAVVEIVSPGNKSGRAALRKFVEKVVEFLDTGIHVLVVDPFPPSPRDPHGIHELIWQEFAPDEFEFPAGKDRLAVSYEARPERVAYIEPLAVGAPWPEVSLFVADGVHVCVPLETTYVAAWNATPEVLRRAVRAVEPG